MCRTYGAPNSFDSHSQRLHAGLTCDATPALGRASKKQHRAKAATPKRRLAAKFGRSSA